MANNIEIKVIQARGLPKADTFGKIDPFFDLLLGSEIQKTSTKRNTYTPIYAETFVFSKDISAKNEVLIKLWDWDAVGSDTHMGSLRIPITGEYINRRVRRWFPITVNNEKSAGEVELEIIHNTFANQRAVTYQAPNTPVFSQRAFPLQSSPPPSGPGSQGYQGPPQGYPSSPSAGYGQPPPGYGQHPPQMVVQPSPQGYAQPHPQGYAQPPQGYPSGYGQPPPQIVVAQPQPIIVQQAPVVFVQARGPRKLYLQQKVFTWGDKFQVRDEMGQPMFWVNGEVFTIGKKLHVLDQANVEVAYIHEKVLTVWAQYEVEIKKPDVMSFTVKREYKIGFGHNFNVLGLNWTLKGDFGAHDYHVYKGDTNAEVMYMHKQWCSWGDSYELIVHDSQTVLPCLCVALSIDAFLAKDVGNNSDSIHHHHHHHRHW